MPDDEPLQKTVDESAPPVKKTAAEVTDAQGMPSALPADDEPIQKQSQG